MVFHDSRGLPAVSTDIADFLTRVRAVPHVVDATSPFDSADRVSADGRTGWADVSFDASGGDVQGVIDGITAEADALRADGVDVDFSSFWFQEGGVPASEGVGLLAAVVILLIAFGSVVAMGLPLITAIAGIVIGLAGVQLWAAVVPTPDFTVQVASMVGIGVGIDYALFIVTRYREALRRTGDVHGSIVEAIDTAGRAVLFAGCTVMISLLGMFLMGLSFLYGLAVGTSRRGGVGGLLGHNGLLDAFSMRSFCRWPSRGARFPGLAFGCGGLGCKPLIGQKDLRHANKLPAVRQTQTRLFADAEAGKDGVQYAV